MRQEAQLQIWLFLYAGGCRVSRTALQVGLRMHAVIMRLCTGSPDHAQPSQQHRWVYPLLQCQRHTHQHTGRTGTLSSLPDTTCTVKEVSVSQQ